MLFQLSGACPEALLRIQLLIADAFTLLSGFVLRRLEFSLIRVGVLTDCNSLFGLAS